MAIFLFSTGLILISVSLHLIIARSKTFGNNLVAGLMLIFTSVLTLGLISCGLLKNKFNFLPCGLPQDIHILIFYFPVMFSYIITCIALEEDSPSMTIARFVQLAGEEGRSREQLNRLISDQVLILPRIKIMVKDGWIKNDNGRYFITPKGRLYSRFFALGLKLLNIRREG